MDKDFLGEKIHLIHRDRVRTKIINELNIVGDPEARQKIENYNLKSEHIGYRVIKIRLHQCETREFVIPLGQAPDNELGFSHIGARVDQTKDRYEGFNKPLQNVIKFVAWGDNVAETVVYSMATVNKWDNENRSFAKYFNPGQVGEAVEKASYLENQGVFKNQADFDAELALLEAIVFGDNAPDSPGPGGQSVISHNI